MFVHLLLSQQRRQMMSKNYIEYSPELIKLFNTIVNKGNQGIKLEKTENGERVFCNYKSASYLFHIDFPVNQFNFDGKEINFYDFGEFANIIKTFKNPNIICNDASLILDMETSSVDYTLGDSDAIKRGFTKSKDAEYVVTFNMSEETIKKLNSVKNLFGSEYLSFVYERDVLKARLTSKTRGDNKYEECYVVKSAEEDVSVEFKTFALVISALGIGSWDVSVSNDGIAKFDYVNTDDINLSLYCLRVDDE